MKHARLSLLLAVTLSYYSLTRSDGYFGTAVLGGRHESHDLTVLPLGDSITWGARSSDGNGYRQALKSRLAGSKVHYIGSQHSGTMWDNSNEGHGGKTIEELYPYLGLHINESPNLVLLMAGTNDMDKNVDVQNAPERLGLFIDEIFATYSDAAVLVAQLIPATREPTRSNIVEYNKKIPGIVASRAKAGKKVLVVSMSAVTDSDIGDQLHPDDEGYSKIAEAWYTGIKKAIENAWISSQDFANQRIISHDACIGSFEWKSRGIVAAGALDLSKAEVVLFGDIDGDGMDDYLSVGSGGEIFAWHNQGASSYGGIQWEPKGSIMTGVGSPRSNIRLADLTGDGRDEYLAVDNATGAVSMWENGGGPDSNGVFMWTSRGQIATGFGEGPGVYFADMDGDGKDDYVWLDTDGAASLWVNGGNDSTGNWIWTSKGVITEGVGGKREDIQLVDIDGDGIADYLLIDRVSGAATMWRNGGGPGEDGKWVWESRGEIAGGLGSNMVVRFAHLSRNGRADYLVVNPNGGSVDMWENVCNSSTVFDSIPTSTSSTIATDFQTASARATATTPVISDDTPSGTTSGSASSAAGDVSLTGTSGVSTVTNAANSLYGSCLRRILLANVLILGIFL